MAQVPINEDLPHKRKRKCKIYPRHFLLYVQFHYLTNLHTQFSYKLPVILSIAYPSLFSPTDMLTWRQQLAIRDDFHTEENNKISQNHSHFHKIVSSRSVPLPNANVFQPLFPPIHMSWLAHWFPVNEIFPIFISTGISSHHFTPSRQQECMRFFPGEHDAEGRHDRGCMIWKVCIQVWHMKGAHSIVSNEEALGVRSYTAFICWSFLCHFLLWISFRFLQLS